MPGIVQVLVVDKAGQCLVLDATVTLDGVSLPLTDKGFYRATVEPGSYTLRVSAPGFKPLEKPNVVEDGAVNQEKVELERELLSWLIWPGSLIIGGGLFLLALLLGRLTRRA